MDLGLLNRISDLAFAGYYDPSKNMVAVHFYSQQEAKPDVIAFLGRDMSWDVREIVSETATLDDSGETIRVEHRKISVEAPGSDFDVFIRAGLKGVAQKTHGEEADLEDKDVVFKILNHGYKDN